MLARNLTNIFNLLQVDANTTQKRMHQMSIFNKEEDLWEPLRMDFRHDMILFSIVFLIGVGSFIIGKYFL